MQSRTSILCATSFFHSACELYLVRTSMKLADEFCTHLYPSILFIFFCKKSDSFFIKCCTFLRYVLCIETAAHVALYAPKRTNLFVLRSLTKSFSIPGVRAGYSIANKTMTDLINRTSMPWNVSVLAQKATCAAVSIHKTYLKKVQHLIKKESDFLQKNINKIDGYKCVQNSSANFILVRTKYSSHALWKKLVAHKILVRDCTSFGALCENHIRIAVKTRAENLKLLEALKSV